jgi:FMN phosphatase YigB (HAD superfamily)
VIKAITFDFWSTLYKSKPINMEERLRFLKEEIETKSKLALTMEMVQSAVDIAREAWNQAWITEQRTMGAPEWLSIVLRELNVTLHPNDQARIELDIENTILDNLPAPVEEAKTVLPVLAARYPLAIISDTGLTPGRVLYQILEKDKLLDYFSYFTFSDQVGSSKPHPGNFLTTLQALGARPPEAVHIGDLLRTDIAGAKQVGMRAVQYVGLNYDNADLNVTPDAIIYSHTELEPLLRRWNNDCCSVR